MRPHGCRRGARPMAYQGDMLSTVDCHFGGFLGFLGCPIRRRCLTPMYTSTAPMAVFSARDANDGAVWDRGGLLPVAMTVTVTTIARETSQPKMKAAPFLIPPFE